METNNPQILIAGASGYIGRKLITKLLQSYPYCHITAISRSQKKSDDPRVTWAKCDLFSLKQMQDAVPENIDLAYYLVHSMGPTAHLDQGGFEDYDLILADNFSRAVKKAAPKQLIYLAGLIPNIPTLSPHLQSRLEVEHVFESFGLPVTVFRAGLILGNSGSSFQMLIKLIKRLPLMICPRWTQTLTTPIDVNTVIDSLSDASLKPECINKTFDLAGCKPLTYQRMMKLTAKKMGLKRRFINVPFFSPTISRFWVSLFTASPRNLVYPLVESLRHPMVARESHLYPLCSMDNDYFSLLQGISFEIRPSSTVFNFKTQRKTVRSVQRLPLPEGKDSSWVADAYIKWLPKFLSPFIKVTVVGKQIYFSFLTRKLVLLSMKLSAERSDPTRQLFYIDGGLLLNKKRKGRLEFREALNKKYIIAAIHNYSPSLPWFVYIYTQAKLHLWVMKAFSKSLSRYKSKKKIKAAI